MTTGTYTIDATNNAEPLDTRFVADFPAELRAMKERMNTAISGIGTLTGALMADGTNYMTGKLGVGVAAEAGKMLHVVGASKLVGSVAITGSITASQSGFSPYASTVANASSISTGAYGGGFILIDSTMYSGMYSDSGSLCLGIGTASGLTTKLKLSDTEAILTGASNQLVEARASSGYAGLSAKSSGSNPAYVFLGNESGEHGRVSADNSGNLALYAGGGSYPTILMYSGSKNVDVTGSTLAIGAGTAGAKSLSLSNSVRTVSIESSADGSSVRLVDVGSGTNRWYSDVAGNFTVPGILTTTGSSLKVGAGTAGTKGVELANNIRNTAIELASDGSTVRLVDYTAGIARWVTDAAGNLTVAGDVTSASDKKLKHDVKQIEYALNLVDSMRGVTFKWNRDGAPGIGFIAQEVETVLPELVIASGDIKTVAYGNITAVLVEAVKELHTMVVSLKEELRRKQ